ncbi:fructose-bisphosphate aldolase class II [Cellulomonas hominis]|uniref:Fructose-bisphosphate aldolase class II n=1 Tax=Cellulomonas hominis TaxID=156981 RepID=A0A7W8SG61_9CELL|nr:class II fructose-bisphosphate aldolase [Cellulomonas hominis]MBB5473490.1 fructose-bisphosphate aldolase class II [Cellulomonas hominis]
MSAVHTRFLVAEAVRTGSAVLAFNVITLEHAEGVADGLERAGVPGLLQVSENAVRYHADRMGPLLAACREVAAAAAVPVGIHLDHLRDEALVRAGVAAAAGLGVTSVMVDASELDDAANVATTAALARVAHGAGLWVEAELGAIGGKGGAHTPGVRTDPDEARAFVAATGVDGLAVAVGSAHAMTSATARLDLGLVGRLAAAVPVPLVLHGSSGVPAATLRAAVAAGIRKVNVGTALNVALTAQVRTALGGDGALTDPRTYLARGREAVAEVVAATARAVLPDACAA